MLKEIGSNFWLDTKQLIENSEKSTKIDFTSFNLKAKDSILLSTGRAAISFVLRQIKEIKGEKEIHALIPPYTCETVLQPFLEEGFKIYTYDLDGKLFLHEECLKAALDVSRADVVLIHRYFGFNTVDRIDEVVRDYQKKGTVFIEDRTQNLFSSFDSLPAEYFVGSFRKWAAIPEGGYCISVAGQMRYEKRPEACDAELVRAKLHAFQLKYDYMVKDVGEKNAVLDAYAVAEHILDCEKDFFCMSEESISLFNQLDVDNLKMARRRNYQYVYENLQGNNNYSFLTGELQDGDVPLYIALKSEKRNQIQAWLREHDVYAPVVWPKPRRMPQVSDTVRQIYDQVICLPIDQRYHLDDMERMTVIIKEFKGK